MSKAWSKATAEQRANHRRRCQESAAERKRINFATKNHETLEALFSIKERYGIEPKELLKFILLMPKGQPPLTDDQNRQWREMAIEKIPAEEIYQRLFSNAA